MEGWWQTWEAPSPLPAHKLVSVTWHWSSTEVTRWTPHTNMIAGRKSKFWKIHPKDSFWFLWPKCSFPHMWKKNSSYFPHIEIYCQERLATFPHILWCEERVSSHFPSPSSISSHFACVELATTNSSHFSTQSSELENQTKNSSHFSNVRNFGKRSFPYINSTHAKNSSLFPHFLLTFSSHWNFIGMQILTFSTVRKSNTHITNALPKKKKTLKSSQ